MGFANYYLSKQNSVKSQIKAAPRQDLYLIIIIPCYNEDELLVALDSLWQCYRPSCSTEVIVIINSSVSDTNDIKKYNLQTLAEAEKWINHHVDDTFKFFLIHEPNLPKKHAGAGFARKIGMDIAVSRFNTLDNPDGLIISFDADCICEKNYLISIESVFTSYNNANCATIYFEHPVEGDQYKPEVYRAIAEYELHLRYHIGYLRQIYFPYAFHTIGSCFVVKAGIYVKQGGMNKKQAGEDFYFLHKIFPSGKTIEINNTRVIPSPRPSLRVPFGTGPSISAYLKKKITVMKTYNPFIYEDIGQFINYIPDFHKLSSNKINKLIHSLPSSIANYLVQADASEKISEINKNTSKPESFVKRFYAWFNAFHVVKFLHFAQLTYYPGIPVKNAALFLLKKNNPDVDEELNEIDLLNLYRTIQKNQQYVSPLQ